MDFKLIFLTVCVCFLACVPVEVSSTNVIWFSSFWRRHNCTNGGGNLIRISTDQCKSSSGQRHCEAKCNGERTTDNNTRFTIETSTGREYIQFEDNQGIRFALKVISNTDIVFEEQRSRSTPSLFDEETSTTYYLYERQFGTKTMCLTCDCNGNLSLSTKLDKDQKDRRCFFDKLCTKGDRVRGC